jgi:hypothetical protein
VGFDGVMIVWLQIKIWVIGKGGAKKGCGKGWGGMGWGRGMGFTVFYGTCVCLDIFLLL